MPRSVCIVGAGIAGVSAVKSCLEEGLQPTCFESRCNLGGLWYYRKQEKTRTGRAYESLITNVSKEASCFSDFPYPKEFPPYFSHAKMLEYLECYAEHFDLEKHIFYRRRVVLIEPTNVDGMHKWRVTTKSTEPPHDQLQEERYFDGVIICTGLNSLPRMPKIEGLQTNFKGKVMHSSDYDSAEEFNGKRVVVIGAGNSGADIVVDLSRQAERAILSSRSGCWIIPRCFEGGLPPDQTATTRLRSFIRGSTPLWLGNWIANSLINSRFNHDVIGLRSRYQAMDPRASLLINDELPARIFSGNVIVRPEVVKVTENEIIFADGRKEEVDCVICASGYDTQFPFINNDILSDDKFQLKLFEWMFPFEYKFPESIAVVGLLPSSGGSAIPAFECQTRYIAQVMAGLTKLPSVLKMRTNYEERLSELPDGKTSRSFRTQLSFKYQDRIARLGDFYRNFWSIFIRNPLLALRVYVGPFLGYHYRLRGRHQWSGAAERIMNTIPNTLFAITKQ